MKNKVLLIDAEPLICARLRKKLEMEHYELRWAADAKDALRSANFQQADLLLLDLDVPPAESLEILSRITELNPVVKVVGLTERTDVPAALLGSGLSAVVEKPIDQEGLLTVMEELLTQAPKQGLRFRLVPRRRVQLQGHPQRRQAEPNICPAAYSGWGINE